MKESNVFGNLPLRRHAHFFADSRFNPEKSNVVQVCHIRRSKGPTVPIVSVRGKVYFGPLYWNLACLHHVVGIDGRNIPERQIPH